MSHGGTIYPFIGKNFDVLATFNALFRGIEPSLSEIFSSNQLDTLIKQMSPRQMFSRLNEIKKVVLTKDSTLADAYARQLDIKLNDLSYVVLFAELVLRDIAQRANGNPFDNTNTIYIGFFDNWENVLTFTAKGCGCLQHWGQRTCG